MTTLGLELGFRAFQARLGRRVRSALSLNRTTYVWERVEEYRRYWADAAAMIGASFHELHPGVWEVRRDGRRTRLANFLTECDDPVTLQLASDKLYGYRLALSQGVPLPEHCVVTLSQFAEAEAFRQRSEGPLVVKPAADSSSGLGVSTGVRTRDELAHAVALASLHGERILVERMVPGESYRLLYLAGCLIHAVRRRGVRIRGDGRATIGERLRAAGAAALERDPLVHWTLNAQSLSMSSIPAEGREVILRGAPGRRVSRELRTVYDEIVTDQCGPELIRAGAAIVRALGSELAGVDLITIDPSRPLKSTGGAFIEINTTPGIHHHCLGPRDHASPVAIRVLEYLLNRDHAAA